MLSAEGRGRGLATEASRLTLDYAFRICQLCSVWLMVLGLDAAAIGAYDRAWFRHVSRNRFAGYWSGTEADELITGVVTDDQLRSTELTNRTS